MQNLSEINTATPEGILLMNAIAIFTINQHQKVLGNEYNGTHMEPDAVLQLFYESSKEAFPQYWQTLEELQKQYPPKEAVPLCNAIAEVINRYSRENETNTPDFILSDYMLRCLEAFEAASNMREEWYGKKLSINYE